MVKLPSYYKEDTNEYSSKQVQEPRNNYDYHHHKAQMMFGINVQSAYHRKSYRPGNRFSWTTSTAVLPTEWMWAQLNTLIYNNEGKGLSYCVRTKWVFSVHKPVIGH